MWHIFKLINTAFLESRESPDYQAYFELGSYGKRAVRFIKTSAAYLVILDGVVFCPGLNGRNPLIKGNKCVMIDEAGDIYAGFWED